MQMAGHNATLQLREAERRGEQKAARSPFVQLDARQGQWPDKINELPMINAANMRTLGRNLQNIPTFYRVSLIDFSS